MVPVPMLGLREFEDALARVAKEADEAGRLAVTKTAALAEAAAKGNFAGSHSKGEPHVDATVGGRPAPNVVTGTLRRSIKADPAERYGIGDYGTRVAPHVKYARRVELGWPAGSGHGAYPYFEPAAEHARAKFPELAAEQWRRFLLA